MTPVTREQRTLAIGLVMGVTLVAFETTAVITALPLGAILAGRARRAATGATQAPEIALR